ncbi:unnamed protein product [Calicophoron daubneyi]|uniref:NudC domain-containing protein 1 n=1 Tax=Calicophoron daubneyi TaxID=300641 RepID=A0AAV2TA55_CALDB
MVTRILRIDLHLAEMSMYGEADFIIPQYVRSLEPPLLCCAAELLDALMIRDSNDGIRELHCLFASIGERPEDLLLPHCSKSGYLSYLEWMHYHFEDSTSNWHLARHRRLASSSFPDYVAFERAAQALHICAENSFWPVYDSAHPEVAEQFKKPPVIESPMNTESSKMSLISMTPEIEAANAGSVEWIQTDSVTEEEGFGTISISFRLSASQMPGVDLPTKDAVHILVAPRTPEDNERQTLKIEILNAANVPHTESSQHASERSSVVLFDHFLYGSVQPDPVWTIDRDELLLDVHLTKTCALCWPRLLFNEQMDRSLVKQKTDDPALDTVPNPSGDETSQVAPLNPAFNIEQLEDIDFPMEDENEDLILQRIDGDTLKVTNQSNLLANQWLFNIQTVRNSTYSATGAVCLRQDVDGIVWLPVDLSASDSGPETSTKSPWRHVATLQAFGYVLASKRVHRFVACPLLADGELLSYVAVADCSRHVFIYRQPISGGPFPGCGTELRRRNVGKEKQDDRSAGTVVHVAWQHVINLPEYEQIIGFVALDKPYPACLICTEQTLYLASLVG